MTARISLILREARAHRARLQLLFRSEDQFRHRKSCGITQTGWSGMDPVSCTDHPAAPFKGCLRRLFLDGASTPPTEAVGNRRFHPFCNSLVPGGECLRLRASTFRLVHQSKTAVTYFTVATSLLTEAVQSK